LIVVDFLIGHSYDRDTVLSIPPTDAAKLVAMSLAGGFGAEAAVGGDFGFGDALTTAGFISLALLSGEALRGVRLLGRRRARRHAGR
jgi:hypothetical protein